MANRWNTVFNKLEKVISGDTLKQYNNVPSSNTYNINNRQVVDVASSPEEYQMKLAQNRQQALLAKQWIKANYDLTNKYISSLNDVKLMYRDADLMDGFPEIGTALDIFSEETTCINDNGFMINVTSKSDRIKSILNDLFVNRLSINTLLPMICRGMCKYGNNFMLLNIDKNNGILGWKELPIHEMERFENGAGSQYPFSPVPNANLNNINPNTNVDDTKFVWIGQNEYIPYRNWQIAHFRLLYDSQFLPYGVSILHKARRHWRMLSMMEDMLLIYRLDRSIERRVFKVNVGSINENDVPSYVQQIADTFKRIPIIDPMTGQIDLRKNVMCQMDDFFIPVRDPSEPSPIEVLPAGNNLTALDDIKFIQNKLFTALRVPKSFLNFEEEKGDGKNLSLMDVRFTRTVNRIQQALIMELNKVAMIHLFLLGFTDDLTNFNITMNNPSSQAEMLEIENLAKKITTAKDAMTPPGEGLPLTSTTWALRNIMKWSDKDIERNLHELRLEYALADELTKTPQIIKRTGLFNPVDNIYGEPDAEYSNNQENDENGMNGGMSGGGGAPIGGGDMDFGDGGDMDDMEMGTEGEMDMETANNEENAINDNNGNENIPPIGDSVSRKLKLLSEQKRQKYIKEIYKKQQHYREQYFNKLCERLLNKETNLINEDKNDDIHDYFNGYNNEMKEIIDQLKDYPY